MNWNNITITFWKELRGILRDKKSLSKLIIFPLLIPTMILLFGFLFDFMLESDYVVGLDYTMSSAEKTIVKDMENVTFRSYANKEEVEAAYEEGSINGYITKVNNTYAIHVDTSKTSGEMVYQAAHMYLESYNQYLGTEYLTKQGIDPSQVFETIVISEPSETTEEEGPNVLITTVFSMVVAYIIMIVVLVCVVVVTDTTSGEKERGTLETILTFPVKSSELVVGKYLASAFLGFVVGLISYGLAIPTFHFGKEWFATYEEVVFTADIVSILWVVFVILLSALLTSGVCMVLAGKAKSYKEAQSSLQALSILPIVPYFMKMMDASLPIMDFVPIANCSALLNDIVIASINYSSLLNVLASTVVYIVAILAYISKQYKKEETLFS
ncbi:MAG: ABC transporter permease [Clostridia bacterium]|nr:ABC transporter permease [Clostridia bacterium]